MRAKKKIIRGIRAYKRDAERFSAISKTRKDEQADLFHDMLGAYEAQKSEENGSGSKSRRYVASNTPVKCPQNAGKASGRRSAGGVMVSDAGREEAAK